LRRALFRALLRSGFLIRRRLFVVRAHQKHTRLQRLLQQIRAAALGAFLVYRLLVRREVALRILRAAVKHVAAPPRLLLDNLALFALRALHADRVLLDVLALW